ncbi:hypothetical protein BD289DRAFT_287211 [Coniella lustricola]|uniref:Uncharacterized protein n=1 Tax=Coniella lustricola TaxID=2025994 RepID=A0A2T3A5M4_9PEZI|nr:hypothetical protein BD289DRAFT_287211 [Coniella lustricola]
MSRTQLPRRRPLIASQNLDPDPSLLHHLIWPRPVSKNNSTRSFDSGSSGLGLPRDDVHDHFVNRIRKINAEKKIRMEDRVRSENEDFVRPWPGSYPKRLDRLKALQSGPLSLSRVRSQSQPSNASPSGSEPPLLDAETHAKLIRERIRTAMAYKQQRAQEFKELYGVPQQAGVGARHIWRTSSSQSDSSTAVEEEKGLQANQGRQIESASYVKQTSQANHSDFKNFENFANHANQATQTTNANKTGKSRRRQKHEQDEEALPVFGPITRARMRWERKRARRLAEKIARNPNWEEADRRRKAARHARKVAEWEQLKAQRQEERREWRARKAYSKGNDWK